MIIGQDSAATETPSIVHLMNCELELLMSEVVTLVRYRLLKNRFNTSIFNLYPNPSKSNFVNITSTGLGVIQAQVYDVLGKQVLNGLVANGRFNVSSLSTGIYVVKLTQNKLSKTKKMIIQ